MVWTGRALPFRRYSMEYAGAEKQAKDAKRAMLKGEFVEPWEWRKQRRR
jgi:endonuclease YncB( thermonuclease family)